MSRERPVFDTVVRFEDGAFVLLSATQTRVARVALDVPTVATDWEEGSWTPAGRLGLGLLVFLVSLVILQRSGIAYATTAA